ncbi:hypothetical protein X801_03759 [Opisthorchis viverrini]|uniref:Uncharacterized protein n=1 Tax=Opisthorchis viverrini TaxID=6198 RepID=A0A1S8X0W6_OPIVI|nr:hypothetical protein X801_03759 [Opisthorchis viverrini]
MGPESECPRGRLCNFMHPKTVHPSLCRKLFKRSMKLAERRRRYSSRSSSTSSHARKRPRSPDGRSTRR